MSSVSPLSKSFICLSTFFQYWINPDGVRFPERSNSTEFEFISISGFKIWDLVSPEMTSSNILLNFDASVKILFVAEFSGLFNIANQISLSSEEVDTAPGHFFISSCFLISIALLTLINNHLMVSSKALEIPKSYNLVLATKSLSRMISR